MQYKKTVVAAAMATSAVAAYLPHEPWSTLTPSATYKGGLTDYSSTFGIAVIPITTSVSASVTGKAKRDAVSQIGDGQIQATTSTKPAKTTAPAVSQIGDGQIQATTSTKPAKTTAPAVSQIGDGQIQATTSTKTTAPAVSQIGDGQIQATTTTLKPKSADAVSQIGDGQIQATTSSKTTGGASQIGDGQVQATDAADSSDPVDAVSCKSDDTLAMVLNGSVLTDSKGRIGSIVANRQFQFDGPPPQAGAIYAGGWSLTPEGNLAIGDNDVFYQCLSGTFYNLYDETLGIHCSPVHLQALDLVDC